MRTRKLKIEGVTFGRLTAIRYMEHSPCKHNGPLVECRCVCGTVVERRLYPLRRGTVQSCGCLMSERLSERNRQARAQLARSFKDRSGFRRGKLMFVRLAETQFPDSPLRWVVRCDCGTEFETRGTTKSKACLSCGRDQLAGANSPVWKGGSFVNPSGYVMVTRKGHHRANSQGYVLEHILVAEEQYGRPIIRGMTVHHINGDRQDNRPENLELWDSAHPSGQRLVDKLDFYTSEICIKASDTVLMRLNAAIAEELHRRNIAK